MKFSEYTYTRPDYPVIKEEFTRLIADLEVVTSPETTRSIILDITKILNLVDTQYNLWMIRHSIDMNDEFYNEETKFWNDYSPLFEELTTNYYRVITKTPFKTELADILPETFFKQAENKLKTFSSEVIPLFQKENQLTDEYSKLIAGATIEFQGKTYNLSQLSPFGQSTDRNIRKAASEASTAYFVEKEADFDRVYDELVKVRTEIAHTLGFKDYVEYGYLKMNRFDYNRDMVKVYREEILKHIVPIVQNLRERQAKRLQVPSLKYYDLNLEFLDGNAVPQGDPDFILDQAQKMYYELSAETGEFFDFMVEHELLDLIAKTGKDSGGYCTYIPDYKSPFIFSNFNGTSGDIDVLTHEAGHAFQVYRSRWIQSPEVVWPTYETCEIHSMSMEFMTWPWMDRFFKEQVDKYKFSHLAGTLLFLPYGVLVDHFQHEVYEHPEMTPAERKATWARLQAQYLPDRDYSDSEALSRGIFWYRQGHIFASPFYYIDYTLAQVCALQFWKRTQVDHDENAWEDYIRICDLGGTKSFLQVVAAANLQSPFKEGALESTAQAAANWLAAVNDTAF
ncbi:M3 family oligoendopeptidase [Streptococcus ruminantium]|uniref:M3 family oligoendopeptidase n=1 Tax=Streptococcus ruminantium TaxID=1917441 RepID=A0ABU1B1U0_9STRE|nr:M3 family oligoendopeptidase [Streptococcus ruminantium]MDQ8759168.1 M3 family oligoendopeptidase [Streptococcus ruminantium]MDQ8767577.1 M3 family oligoendopeptidase [Streptococcus ruminantium]MDQ8768682.1 M3 family oligoendopeptidase [Streptococcus ruminantium]MDQ8774451.1 M3 family oligoendopeptidase [Streptococcus ruminantium]MDQ8793831.1 M3 family oligoendopeptidase [Streptococcus ruminantium]